MVRAWGDDDHKKAAQRVLDKVSAVVTPDVKQGLEDARIGVPDFHVPSDVRERLGIVREGVQVQRKVRFRYTRADGDERKRMVRPLGLFYWGSTWSLAAWCEMRKGFRNFRIDRMEDAKLMKTTFKEESGKTLKDFFKSVGVD